MSFGTIVENIFKWLHFRIDFGNRTSSIRKNYFGQWLNDAIRIQISLCVEKSRVFSLKLLWQAI